MDFDYQILDNSIDANSFCCGISDDHEKLNRFLKERAVDHQNDLIGTTTIIFDKNENNKLISYITLLADTIQVEDRLRSRFLSSVGIGSKYDSYPALKIGRIAVDEKYQNKKFGTYLFKLTTGFAYYCNEELGVGIRFIVVDTKDMAKDWYLKKLNFRIYDDKHPNFLYYDLKGWKDETK